MQKYRNSTKKYFSFRSLFLRSFLSINKKSRFFQTREIKKINFTNHKTISNNDDIKFQKHEILKIRNQYRFVNGRKSIYLNSRLLFSIDKKYGNFSVFWNFMTPLKKTILIWRTSIITKSKFVWSRNSLSKSVSSSKVFDFMIKHRK